MKTLHLLRHAKSSWEDESLPDHERPLAPRGRRAARQLAKHLGPGGLWVGLVLCSSAVRTRQTLDLLRPALPDNVPIEFEDELYGAGTTVLIDRLQRLPSEIGSVLVVGHNPGMEDLVATLAGGVPRAFPTGALATLRVRGDWASLERGGADLTGFVEPREFAG